VGEGGKGLNVDPVVERLSRDFTARDVMTPRQHLVRAADERDALALLDQHRESDVILIERGGVLTAYVEQGTSRAREIGVADVVCDATSILDLVETLREWRFCFVLGSREIVGYVRFSDLSSHVVKLPLFVLLEAVESVLADRLRPKVTEATLDEAAAARFVDASVPSRIRKTVARVREGRADRGYVEFLGFGELLRLAVYFGMIDISEDVIKRVKGVRDGVCHAKLALVMKHDDVRCLSEARHTCLSVLGACLRSAGSTSAG